MLLLKLEQLQESQEKQDEKHITLPQMLDGMGTVPEMLKALNNHTIPCALQFLVFLQPHMLTPILEHILKTSSPQVVRYWDTVELCEHGRAPGFLGDTISPKCSRVLGNILTTRPTGGPGTQGKQWHVYTPHTKNVSTMGLDELTCFPQGSGSVPIPGDLMNFGLRWRLENVGAVVADNSAPILSEGGPGVNQELLAQAQDDERAREKLMAGLRLFHEAHQLIYKYQWLTNHKNPSYDGLLRWMVGRLHQLCPGFELLSGGGVPSFIVAATSGITPGGGVALDEGRVHGFMSVIEGVVSEAGVRVTSDMLVEVYEAARGVYGSDDAVDWGFLGSAPAPMVAAMLGITLR